ncbi:MAG: hypothetical protein JNK38_12295 [Acidobacteria bacterium]|nr:hypothetical protein [Acidobacteriota bacterium]
MVRIKWVLVVSFALAMAIGFSASPQKSLAQKQTTPYGLGAYRDNQCVVCHLSLTEPLRISAHFYEWLNSKHSEKAVGCEKCHGGNALAKDKEDAHKGVLRSSFPQSRLHLQNLPATCNSCHQETVTAFVQSKHFQALKDSGVGPSCTTCHHHMASAVIYWPPETSQLCAACHKAEGNPAARYAQAPAKAADVLLAFNRADEVIEWSQFLISEGHKRRMQLKAEEEELKKLSLILKDAKVKWHEFDLEGSRQHADQVFMEATNVKNRLVRKGL